MPPDVLRLAWFTPLPPVTSGVARYNAELLPGLSSRYAIDVFVDGDPRLMRAPDARARLLSAHDFLWRHFQRPYDLVVYQLGNAPCHDYMWAYLVRHPGLVVLHDGQLHHARGRLLMHQRRADDYRSEFRYCDPKARPDMAEIGIAGLLGSLTYLWPMRRVVVESARAVVVHNEWLAAEIRDESPTARVEVVGMGVPDEPAPADARERMRARHGISPGAIVFTAFGTITPEKRIPQVIRALAALAASLPDVHLLLVGDTVDHYNARADAEALGVGDRVTLTGFVEDREVPAYLSASDSCLCLRWPSSRETSAAWLRAVAAARPTVVTDLVHTVDIPALDPRNWMPLHAPDASPQPAGLETPRDPVCISVDVLDEDHSLRIAMRRLATDPRLRATIGANARRLWSDRFRLDSMVSRYIEAIDAAVTLPPPDGSSRARLPRHFLADGTEPVTKRLRDLGLSEARIGALWSAVPTASGGATGQS
jgi:glycosyltransferase involved in cell wall biosynthesis